MVSVKDKIINGEIRERYGVVDITENQLKLKLNNH